jgi:hypothetical protein
MNTPMHATDDQLAELYGEGVAADFSVANHGSVLILYALTDAARAWVDEHIPEDAMTWGHNGTVVEPRYIANIVEGIRAAGLEVSP